ncbi:hypothetical protein DERP_005812 [Dermatophagoides pteronyssinus]|uniref:Uncharacterized protein n=1 Tax=Dermatophagoides pteronyssinus TaxID=6956 RepID=A0ABQ8JA84_DERPT|nr:hypothetical protein DERP_005812 [Dermatophagoides pteronyssinus]
MYHFKTPTQTQTHIMNRMLSRYDNLLCFFFLNKKPIVPMMIRNKLKEFSFKHEPSQQQIITKIQFIHSNAFIVGVYNIGFTEIIPNELDIFKKISFD